MDKLIGFIEIGTLEIHNISRERSIKPFDIGR
ncbi:hypothetical protein [Bacillus sp. FSL K6-3431]